MVRVTLKQGNWMDFITFECIGYPVIDIFQPVDDFLRELDGKRNEKDQDVTFAVKAIKRYEDLMFICMQEIDLLFTHARKEVPDWIRTYDQ